MYWKLHTYTEAQKPLISSQLTDEQYACKKADTKATHCQSTNHNDKHSIPVDVMD